MKIKFYFLIFLTFFSCCIVSAHAVDQITLSVVPESIKQNTATVNWTSLPSGVYNLRLSEYSNPTGYTFYPDINSTAFNITGLTSYKAYNFVLEIFYMQGNTPVYFQSNVVTFRTLASGIFPPVGVTATVVSQTAINLKWYDVSSYESSYRVERSSKPDMSTIDQTYALNSNSESLAMTGLTRNTIYYIRVTAVWTTSASALVVSARTYDDAPNPVTGLTVTDTFAHEIRLMWQSTDSKVTGFRVEAQTGGGDFQLLADLGPTVRAYNAINLNSTTTYVFKVTAFSYGPTYSTGVTVPGTTINYIPEKPTNLAAVVRSNARVDLTWADNSTNEEGFTIQRRKDGGAWALLVDKAQNEIFHSDQTIPGPGTYDYRIFAYSTGTGGGNSDYSNTATADLTFGNPDNVTVTKRAAVWLDIAWRDNSSCETGFEIERGTSLAGPFTKVGEVGPNTFLYSDKGLPGSTAFYYRVRAIKSGPVYSAYSDVVRGDTDPSFAPTLTASASSPVAVNLSWNFGTGSTQTRFDVEVSLDGVTYTVLAPVASGTNTYTDETVNPNTKYFYRIHAIEASATAYTNTSTLTTPPVANYPVIPDILTAASLSATEINLTWHCGYGLQIGFKIERSKDGTNFTEIGTIPYNIHNSSCTFAFTSNHLYASTKYYYRVKSYTLFQESPYSALVDATTNSTTVPYPAVPSSVTLNPVPGTTSQPGIVDIVVAPAANDNATAYLVERGLNTTTYTTLTYLTPAGLTYRDGTVTPGTVYYYRVWSENAKGLSLTSVTASIKANEFTLPAPQSFTISSAVPAQLSVSWALVPNPTWGTVTGYRIKKSTDGTNFTIMPGMPLSSTRTSYTDTGVTIGSQYYYKVCAIFTDPATSTVKESAESPVVSGTVVAPLGLPVGLTGDIYVWCVHLAWQCPTGSQLVYKIERSKDGVNFNEVGATQNNFTYEYYDVTVRPNIKYYFRVRSSNGSSNSAYSNVYSITTPVTPVPAPLTPVSITAAPVPPYNAIDVTIVDAEDNNTDTFELWRTHSSGWGEMVADNIPKQGVTTVYRDSYMACPGWSYSYRLIAKNSVGESGYLQGVTFTVPSITIPAAPTNLTATVLSNISIGLTWTDNANNEFGYKVELNFGSFWTEIASIAPDSTAYTYNYHLPEQYTLEGCRIQFRVYAYNTGTGGGNSGYANTVVIVPYTTPASLRTTGTAANIKLTWIMDWRTSPRWEIDRATAETGPFTLLATTTSLPATAQNEVSYTDYTASAGITYYYRVRAFSQYTMSDNSNVASGAIYTGPKVQGTIVINGGAKYTLDKVVFLTLSATSIEAHMADNGKMCFSENGTTWTAWENYSVLKEYELPKGNGTKTVYVKYKDKLGNESAGTISASIQLAEPAKMAGVSYLDGVNLTAGVVMNFGQRAGIKLYNKSSGVSQVIHSMAGSPAPECKSITRARLNSSSYDDLVVDFGPVYGIWVCNNCTTWANSELHPLTAESITAADINNDGKDELIIDFGASVAHPYKVWVYAPSNGSWTPLHTISPRSISSGNLDGMLGADLVVDFGIYGIWVYYNDTSWAFLHPLTAEQIVVGNINADSRDEIVTDFGEVYGVWVNYPGVTDPNLKWKLIEGQNPKQMAIGNIDVDGANKKDIVFDFGDNTGTANKSGIDIWANDAGLVFLHPLTSEGLVFSGNDLVVDFAGYGEWIYKGSLTQAIKWAQLGTVNAE